MTQIWGVEPFYGQKGNVTMCTIFLIAFVRFTVHINKGWNISVLPSEFKYAQGLEKDSKQQNVCISSGPYI